MPGCCQPFSNIPGQRKVATPLRQREERHRHASALSRLPQCGCICVAERCDQLRATQQRAVELLQFDAQLFDKVSDLWLSHGRLLECRVDHAVFALVTALARPAETKRFCTSNAMPAASTSRRRGRPPRNPVDLLFTGLWFSATKARSGLPSAYAIELSLESGRVRRVTAGVIRPRKWDTYAASERVPSRNSLTLAEARYPGTARIFDSPVRKLLRGDPVRIDWIYGQLLSLPQEFVELLFLPAINDFPASLLGRELREFNPQQSIGLARLGGLHALEAAVLLMKLGELMPSPDLRRLARESYIRSQPSMRVEFGAAPALEELFDFIDTTFPLWLYRRPDLRWEVVRRTGIRRQGMVPLTPDAFIAQEYDPASIRAMCRVALLERVLKAEAAQSTRGT